MGILIVFAFLFWLLPVVMFIRGLLKLKSRPRYAKVLLISSGIWLTVGIGLCASL